MALVLARRQHTFRITRRVLRCRTPRTGGIFLKPARQLTKLAAEKKVATQLGVQRHTLKSIRSAVELIQSGAIGQVSECHAWIEGDRGMPPVPTEKPPVPANLAWDLWLGPAAARDF